MATSPRGRAELTRRLGAPIFARMVHVKRALVCGAGGFIGSHLVRRLRADGYWVRGADLTQPAFAPPSADDFLLLDLRSEGPCDQALELPAGTPRFDEVYQLAAER